jgi:DNA-directed RNA polymerase subunit M/transcription elongation factor TFIIS
MPPKECPKCKSKRIMFHADASFLMGVKKPVKWSCKKCKHVWTAPLP